MPALTRDPLLAVAKTVLIILMAVLGIATVACLVAVPAIWIFQNLIAAEIAKEAPGFSFHEALFALSMLLLLAAGLIGMIFRILQLLKRIVGTVGEGDPFVPVNATRLTHMAWLTLGTQLITLPMAGLGFYLYNITEPIRDEDPGANWAVDGGFDLNGIMLMLILFILARVFRKGAEMREELEGTV